MSVRDAKKVLKNLLSNLEEKKIYLSENGNTKIKEYESGEKEKFLSEDNIKKIQEIFRALNMLFEYLFEQTDKYDLYSFSLKCNLEEISLIIPSLNDISNGNIIAIMLLKGYIAKFGLRDCYFKLSFNEDNLNLLKKIKEKIKKIPKGTFKEKSEEDKMQKIFSFLKKKSKKKIDLLNLLVSANKNNKKDKEAAIKENKEDEEDEKKRISFVIEKLKNWDSLIFKMKLYNISIIAFKVLLLL